MFCGKSSVSLDFYELLGRMETVQVIIKALLSLMEEFKQFNVFVRERKVYELVLSPFSQMYKDVGVDIEFGPK